MANKKANTKQTKKVEPIVEEVSAAEEVIDAVIDEMLEEAIAETPVEEVIETIIEEAPVEEVIDAPVEEIAASIVGVVFNCCKLNIRASRNIKANVLEEVDAGDELDVIETFDEWLHVITKNGTDGFCMKQYVKI